MEPTSSRKRPIDDVDNTTLSAERRVRFPKGKKAKRAGEKRPVDDVDDGPAPWEDAGLAARERAKRRTWKVEEDVVGEHVVGTLDDIVARSEIHYEENDSFDDDGIQIEPFNLNSEREDGYFDESGNYVEYVRNEIKDAWLDSIDTELKFSEKKLPTVSQMDEEDYQDLPSAELGRLKRSIANVLKPGETVMQALRRLKGTVGDKKHKMSDDTKFLFDQLTENAMKLMDNGEYNVYHDERETFVREAEGYERLARVKDGSSNGIGEAKTEQPVSSDGNGLQESHTSILDRVFAPSEGVDGGNELDMFGEDEDTEEKSSTNPNPNVNHEEGNSGIENDYIFDDATGYYYSSSLGYYYDPGSGLYYSAMSGKWYSYNEQTGAYDEIPSQEDPASASVTN